MPTDPPRRVKCDRCDKTFVLAADDSALPPHDDESQQPCPGSRPVALPAAVAVGDKVDAWLPPPTHFERTVSSDPDAVNLSEGSRRGASVLSVAGSKMRVRDEQGDEYDIDAADLGEAQPEWTGK